MQPEVQGHCHFPCMSNRITVSVGHTFTCYMFCKNACLNLTYDVFENKVADELKLSNIPFRDTATVISDRIRILKCTTSPLH